MAQRYGTKLSQLMRRKESYIDTNRSKLLVMLMRYMRNRHLWFLGVSDCAKGMEVVQNHLELLSASRGR